MKKLTPGIQIPALPRFTIEGLKKETGFPKIQPDDRQHEASIWKNTSPESPITLCLLNFLEEKENFIRPRAIGERMEPYKDSLLGYQHVKWLVDNQKNIPQLKGLRALIYFPGTEIILESGHQVIPCMQHDANFVWSVFWATIGLFDMDRSVYMATGE